MDFKNVDLNDYCFNLELHKSMFFFDMLKDTYEFTLKGDEIEIFKKLKSGISEPITRKELIYSIQVEMTKEYNYSSLDKETLRSVARAGNLTQYCEVFRGFRNPSKIKSEKGKLNAHQNNVKLLIIMFYHLFDGVDNIHKAIDNMIYLEKYLNKKEESSDEEEEDEESSDEEEQVGPQNSHSVQELEEQISQLKAQQERKGTLKWKHRRF